MGPNRIQLRRKNRHIWEEFAGQLAGHCAEGMALTVIGVQRSRPSLYDITDQLAGITAPTLVVNGDAGRRRRGRHMADSGSAVAVGVNGDRQRRDGGVTRFDGLYSPGG